MLPKGKWLHPEVRGPRKFLPPAGRYRVPASPVRRLRQRANLQELVDLGTIELNAATRLKARRAADPHFDRACVEHERYPDLTLEELTYRYRTGRL